MVIVRSRGRTYAALVGAAAGALLTGVVLPFAIGDPPERGTSAIAAPGPASPSERPAHGPATADPAAGGVGDEPAADLPVTDAPTGAGPRGPARAPAPVSAAARTASAVGVTPDEIRLGFVLINVGPANELGTVVGLEVEQQRQAIEILVERRNAGGGIHGRRVRPVFAVWDVLDPSSGRTACLRLTEDGKVFAAIGSMHPPDVSCYTREHGTTLLWNCQACPDSSFEISRGLILSGSMRGSAHMAGWVAQLERARYLEATKVGIVTDETTDPRAEMAGQVAAALEGTGREVARISRLSGDLSQGSSQIPVEVSQMRAAGAEAVLFVVNRIYATQFVQQADGQGWDPIWSTSEAGSLNVDTCCEHMPESFDGTLGLTTQYDDTAAEPAASRACREAHDAEAPEPLDERGSNEYSLTMGWCDYIDIFHLAADAAGPDLTRAAFDAAGQRLGPLGPLAGTVGGRFAPGKVDLEDHARLQVWRAECRCWRGAGPFQRVR